jgi:predicted O-methyltransferase YrrM
LTARLRLGLIVDPEFVLLDRSVVATTPSLVRGFCQRFDTRVIHDQATFDARSEQIDFLLSLDPGWAAPVVEWRRDAAAPLEARGVPSYVMISDPHDRKWREEYILDQGIDFALVQYWHPTLTHFQTLPRERLVHFPWTVPDSWIANDPVRSRGQTTVAVFGASEHEAYALRNWCRKQPGVASFTASGVENKVYREASYLDWLSSFDAAVAAGSEDPAYRLTTPKYFEIAAAGVLLFAQATDDLERLGFVDGQHCVTFTRETFRSRVNEYLDTASAARWRRIREAGRELVRTRHSLTRRLDELDSHVRATLAVRRPSWPSAREGRDAEVQVHQATLERLHLPDLGALTTVPSGMAGHALFLFNLTRALRARHVVEIGFGGGNSAVAFLLALRETGGVLTSIDVHSPSSQALERIDAVGGRAHWRFIEAASDEAVSTVRSLAPIDVLLIDGCHSYDQCRRDYLHYAPLVRRGGYVLFHDSSTIEGVMTFVDELVARGLGGVNLDYANGLFVVRRLAERVW